MQRLADRVSAVFVPVVIGVAVVTLVGWLAAGAGGRCGVHRRGRGADHRLPVRARPGHADRAAGRHRSRRAARHPDQGPGGARVDPADRHDRARQDRHRHDRPDEPGRGPPPRARTPASCCGWPARWRTPPSIRSPRRSRPRPERLGGRPLCTASAAPGAWASGRRRRSPRGGRAGGLAGSRSGRCRSRRPAARAAEAEAAGRTAVLVGWDGGRRAVLVVADTVKPTSAEAIGGCAALGLRPVLLTGDNEPRRPRRWPRGRHRAR